MIQKFLRNFFIGSALLLLLCMATVVLFDPFFNITSPCPA